MFSRQISGLRGAISDIREFGRSRGGRNWRLGTVFFFLGLRPVPLW